MINFATMDDLAEMDFLRRNNQEAVGFVPISKWEWHVINRPKTLICLRENSEITGYIYWTPGLPVAAIQQLVVRKDARRFERGSALVDAAILAMKAPSRFGVTCRCRENLEAVLFWEAIGWEKIRLEQSGRRGPLWRFYLELQPCLFNLGIYLPQKFVGGGQRKGFRFIKQS